MRLVLLLCLGGCAHPSANELVWRSERLRCLEQMDSGYTLGAALRLCDVRLSLPFDRWRP